MAGTPDKVPYLSWESLPPIESEVDYGYTTPRDVVRGHVATGMGPTSLRTVRSEMIDAERTRRKELAIKQAHRIIDTMTEFLQEQGEQ